MLYNQYKQSMLYNVKINALKKGYKYRKS